jgi:hypothetical protein
MNWIVPIESQEREYHKSSVCLLPLTRLPKLIPVVACLPFTLRSQRDTSEDAICADRGLLRTTVTIHARRIEARINRYDARGRFLLSKYVRIVHGESIERGLRAMIGL